MKLVKTYMFKKIKPSHLIISHKILSNLLIFFLFSWLGALLTEALLPGFLSSHISFFLLLMIVTLLVSLISVINQKLEIKQSAPSLNNHAYLFGLILFLIIITILSLLKFNAIAAIIITLTTLAILYYLHKLLFQES